MKNNHTRAFPDLVSLESWHSETDTKNVRSLHIDASFSDAKVGDDPKAKVRFTLTVRRAQLSFCVPSNSEISIVQKSVARESTGQGTMEKTQAVQRQSAIGATASLNASSTPSIDAKLSASTSLSSDKSEISRVTRSIGEIDWKHKQDRNRNHCWEVSPVTDNTLSGKPWDAVNQPRLMFKFIKSLSEIDDLPSIRLTCRREDLAVTGLESKSATQNPNLVQRFRSNKMAAAEAAIKAILESEGLDHSDISEKYSRITLADTLVFAEVE